MNRAPRASFRVNASSPAGLGFMLLRVAKWPLLAAVSLAVYLGCCQVQARCQPEARGGTGSLKGEQRGQVRSEPGPGPGPAGAGGKSHCQWQRPPGLPPLATEAHAQTASPPTRGQSLRTCLGLGPGPRDASGPHPTEWHSGRILTMMALATGVAHDRARSS